MGIVGRVQRNKIMRVIPTGEPKMNGPNGNYAHLAEIAATVPTRVATSSGPWEAQKSSLSLPASRHVALRKESPRQRSF